MSVLIGPNNSGKTVAAKIIHGVCQAAAPGRQRPPLPAGAALPSDKGSRDTLDSVVDAVTLMRHAGLRPDDVPMHGRKTSSLFVRGLDGAEKKLNFASAKGNPLAHGMSLARDQGTDDIRRSVYLNATRAGGIRYVLNSVGLLVKLARMQNNLLSQMMATAVTEGEKIARMEAPAGTTQLLADPFLGDTAQHIEIMGTILANGLDKKAQATFDRLFPGSIKVTKHVGTPSVSYEDPSGHASEIGSAGSGVSSLLALAAGIHCIEPGGTLIVEEPESHLEPQRQLTLVDEILRASDENGIGVVITTQSDFLVQKMLSLVSSGRLDPSDLGLYYFNRPAPESPTRIERLHVDKSGEAEQEMFARAIDSLIEGFSGRSSDSDSQHSARRRYPRPPPPPPPPLPRNRIISGWHSCELCAAESVPMP